MRWRRRRQRATNVPLTHVDHSCVSRAEYDELFKAFGHLRWRLRELDAENAELRKKGCMTERAEHIEVEPPTPVYGWCAPCGHCHEAPFHEALADVDEERAA